MKFLVTGASGFLGSWLCRHLIESGHKVRALSRHTSEELIKLGAELVAGDVTNSYDLIKACDSCDGVFHLAGLVSYSPTDKAKMEKINVLGTELMLRAAQDAGVKRFIHMSSVVAVGASLTPHVLIESSHFNLEKYGFGYVDTKKAAEDLALSFEKKRKMDVVIINPSTTYGPGDAKKGSRKIQVKVAQGKFPFFTQGGVSVVPVQAVAEATLNAFLKGRSGERYILSGDNLTIEELFRQIALASHVMPPYILLPTSLIKEVAFINKLVKKDPLSESTQMALMYHWFDNKKASQELDFKPGPAYQAIEASVRWMKENQII